MGDSRRRSVGQGGNVFRARDKIGLALLIVAGLFVALKLLHIDYMVNYSGQPYKSFCNINETFNCDAVAASSYSRVFGVPVAFIGFLGNLFLLLFLFLGPSFKAFKPVMRQIYVFIFGFYTAVCILLAGISFFLLPSLCYVCVIFWLISLVTFAYIVVISWGILKPGSGYWKTLCTWLKLHKLVVFTPLAIFFGINGCVGFILSRIGCENKAQASLQCEHYIPESNLAFLGKTGAKLEVIVYTDFQCPWCRRAHGALLELVKKYENRVRFIRKEFPLDMECNRMVTSPFHDKACQISRLAKCAGKQGKYWAFHDEIYRNQEILSDDTVRNVLKMLSMDWQALNDCANSEEIINAVKADIEEGISYKVSGTPAFRIFGELFVGVLTEEAIQDYLTYYPAIKASILMRVLGKGMGENIQIVDIRKAGEYAKNHIGGAVNLPGEKSRVPLDPNKPTILYGDLENEMDDSFNHLKEEGFSSLHILYGGYGAWKKEIHTGGLGSTQ